MLSTCCRHNQRPISEHSGSQRKTYTEVPQVVNAHAKAEEVEESILEHASVAVSTPELANSEHIFAAKSKHSGAARKCNFPSAGAVVIKVELGEGERKRLDAPMPRGKAFQTPSISTTERTPTKLAIDNVCPSVDPHVWRVERTRGRSGRGSPSRGSWG